MKNLISLEQYVLNTKRPIAGTDLPEADYYYQEYSCLEDIVNYTKLLQQQPQLNQFISCVKKEGKWVVLEKPNKKYYQSLPNIADAIWEYDNLLDEYQSASKNVLFDGWEIAYNSFDCVVIRHEFCEITFRELNTLSPKISVTDFTFSDPIEKDNASYSDLTKYNLPLTDNGEIYFNLKN